MSKFKPGDKIRFVGEAPPHDATRIYVGPHPIRADRAVYYAFADGGEWCCFDHAYEIELELIPDPKEDAIKKVVELLCDEFRLPGKFAREAAGILDDAGLLKY